MDEASQQLYPLLLPEIASRSLVQPSYRPAPSLKVISVLGSSPSSLLPEGPFLTDSTVISSNWTHAASRLLVSKDIVRCAGRSWVVMGKGGGG